MARAPSASPSTTLDPVSRRRAYRTSSNFSGRREIVAPRSARGLASRSRVASSRRTAVLSRSRAHRAKDPLSRLQCLSRRNTAPDVTTLFDEPPLLRMGDCLETIVRAELAVDMMEVVAERLAGDTQPPRNASGVAAVREELENATLLLGKRLDRRVLGGIIGEPNESLGDFHHLVEQLLLAAALADVVRQTHKEPAARSMVVEDNRRNVHPDSASIAHT